MLMKDWNITLQLAASAFLEHSVLHEYYRVQPTFMSENSLLFIEKWRREDKQREDTL